MLVLPCLYKYFTQQAPQWLRKDFHEDEEQLCTANKSKKNGTNTSLG